MSGEVRFRDFYRAWLLRESNADDLQASMDKSEYRSSDEFISAVFCVAIEQRFKDDSSLTAIRSFMDEAKYNFEDADPPLKLLTAEVLIRAVFGEDKLLDELDADDFAAAQMPITLKIVTESPQLQTRIDDLLDDAEKIAAHWASQAE